MLRQHSSRGHNYYEFSTGRSRNFKGGEGGPAETSSKGGGGGGHLLGAIICIKIFSKSRGLECLPPPPPPPPPNLHTRTAAKHFYPARTCAARGYVIGRGVYILYIVCLLYIYISAKTFFYLSKYSLSDAHFNTGRLLFEFNRLQYTLAAPEVFVASANPVNLPSGYRVSVVRNTH